MSVGEYFLALMAIVSGLALTDMVSSLHGLLRRFRRVDWDFLPVTAAALIFVALLYSWFVAWITAQNWTGAPFWQYLISMGQLIALFLSAKAVLPDDDGTDDGVGLLDHYVRHNRYVWLAFGSTILLTIVWNAVNFLRHDVGLGLNFLRSNTVWLSLTAVLLSLALIQNLRWHRVIVPTLLVGAIVNWHGRTLEGVL